MHEFHVHSTLCFFYIIPYFKRTYARVSPARFTIADIRKVIRCKNSICVHFRIPFSTSLSKDFLICRYICDIFGHAQYVRETVFFPTVFLQSRIILVFPCSLVKIIDDVEHPWCLSSHGKFLGVLIYCVNFTLALPTCISASV